MIYPFITVWIIARNEERAIKNTLEHLLLQDYPSERFEIIISNWDSIDNTELVAFETLKNSNVAFKILNTKNFTSTVWGPNFGPCFARNLIIDQSSSEALYIAFLDADCRTEQSRLRSLAEKIEENKTNSTVAWIWWSRYVDEVLCESKKELMLNYYFTSCIISMRNPAFCSKYSKTNDEMNSIAWYNSIYKKSILEKYRYDDFLKISDDVEINYRIKQDWLKFLYSKEAIIYHREENSVMSFLRNMMRYGINMWNVLKKHHWLIRPYVLISIMYFFYIILLPFLMYTSSLLLGSLFIPFIPFILVFILSFLVFLENYKNTHSFISLYVFIIVPIHPFLYAYGILLNISGLQKTFSR